jgi:predicted transcriptional regulator
MDYCINDTYTIKEAMDDFEKNHDRAAIVVNKSGKVIGVLSQGDIIRALANNTDMYTHVKTILLPSFLYLEEKNMEMAYKIFKEKKISLLPVVNSKFEMRDVITINDIFAFLESR